MFCMIWATNHSFCHFYACTYQFLFFFLLQNITTNFFLITFFCSRYPFNWKTTLGYGFALLAESIGISCSAFSATPVICFLVGSCWFLKAFVEDITNDLSFLTADDLSPDDRNRAILKRFFNVIQNFSLAEQLSRKKNI